jgi:hypothetical protein
MNHCSLSAEKKETNSTASAKRRSPVLIMRCAHCIATSVKFCDDRCPVMGDRLVEANL